VALPPVLGIRAVPGMLARLFRGFELGDVLSTREHSDDFIDTRAEYIAVRLRFMILFYAVVLPAWIPLDYLLLRPEHVFPMVQLRLLMGVFLFALGTLGLQRRASRQVHVVLALMVSASCAFYAAAITTLASGVAEAPLAGYTAIPCLTIAMLGVFPLTLAWGFSLIAAIAVMVFAVQLGTGHLLTLAALNELWVIAMAGAISLWIQAGQMLMLLKLYRESTLDPLTGLINRRVLIKRLNALVEHANRTQQTSCVLMFDLDRFKRINDRHGHLLGDAVLRIAAGILEDGLRKHDVVARFGGEEFVAVLPDSTIEGAIAVAERIRQAVEAVTVPAGAQETITLSTSVGVTAYEPGEAIDTMLNRLDGALYQAKKLGRNRVVHSQSGSPPESATAAIAALPIGV
jgi:diguanylate cyclase (GGDEF)-like protein